MEKPPAGSELLAGGVRRDGVGSCGKRSGWQERAAHPAFVAAASQLPRTGEVISLAAGTLGQSGTPHAPLRLLGALGGELLFLLLVELLHLQPLLVEHRRVLLDESLRE